MYGTKINYLYFIKVFVSKNVDQILFYFIKSKMTSKLEKETIVHRPKIKRRIIIIKK